MVISKNKEKGQWGRALTVGTGTLWGCILIMLFCPLLVLYFYVCAFSYDCSLTAPIFEILSGNITLTEMLDKLPKFSFQAFWVLVVWLSLQLVLAVLPDAIHHIIKSYDGGYQLGAVTPADNRLRYNINGLQAWIVSHLLFFVGAYGFGWFSPTIIFDNWGGLLIIANIIGFALAIFCYIKANLFPTFPDDRKFSGNKLYDFYMGIELNPRIGPIDFKLFFNGRPGIIAWTLINISFVAAQYERYGTITNSLLLVNFLHAMYVVYFFWKEKYYLYTIDIHHDHFGWMLSWGDSVWLPFMYTLQGLFLVFHPVELSVGYALFVLALGIFGFWLSISANIQKEKFRSNDGDIHIWNKKVTYIPCQYETKDGEIFQTKLLTSGWWGVARHMNYTGDIILSAAFCLVCGFEYIFPYFYLMFISILLLHRCIRDEHRCRNKYGAAWDQYTKRVPYRILPGLF